MARIDFRVQPGFFHHPKTICLREACGSHAVLCLLQLWSHAAENAPDGKLDAMSDASIEIAAGWIGSACEKGKLVVQLRHSDSLFLDGKQLHDWHEHQPFLSGHKARSKCAQNAARMRWAKKKDAEPCDADAPSPSPLPSPSPSPKDLKESKITKVDTSTSADRQISQDVDFCVKAIRRMASKSRVFEMDLTRNGDLHKKMIDWSRKCSGLPWVMFCMGNLWQWVQRKRDCGLGEWKTLGDPIGGENDIFATAGIERPLNYLYSMVFPREKGREPSLFTFDDQAFNGNDSVERIYKTFGFDKMGEKVK